MSAYAHSSTAREAGPPAKAPASQPDDDRSRALSLGIGFDGRHYRYRDFRYERLADAMDYARLDQARPGGRPPGERPQWLEPAQPTEAERRMMDQFGIVFDGRCYLYGGYRYDHCRDAVNYARLKAAGPAGG